MYPNSEKQNVDPNEKWASLLLGLWSVTLSLQTTAYASQSIPPIGRWNLSRVTDCVNNWVGGVNKRESEGTHEQARVPRRACQPLHAQCPSDSCKTRNEFTQERGRMHKGKACGHGWIFRQHIVALIVHSTIELHNDKRAEMEVSKSNNNVYILAGNREFTTLERKTNLSDVFSID